MGLLDQFKAYIQANTPLATRPVAKPSDVIRQGLLDPNKYNAPAANRFKDSAFGLLGGIPGADAPVGFTQGADLWNRGEKGAAAVSVAGGLLPFIPVMGGMFVGKGAKTWDALKAQQAEEMLKQGVDPREVWKQTGTAKFADGMLRQEIPDNAARMSGFDPTDEIVAAYKSGGIDAMNQRKEELADYVRPYQRTNYRQDIDNVFSHDGMMDSYSDLMHYGKYEYDGTNPRIGEGAYYSNKPDAQYAYDLIKLSPANEPTARSAMLHELQHAIQQREGWAKGGSPDMMRQELAGGDLTGLYTPEELNNAYRRLAGEAEARLTQSRMGLDAAQRLEHYPYDMGQYGLDVPMESLIVRGLLGGDTGPAMSISPTKYELAHQTAQKNAVDMLGLPPGNTAMDRARAMGFDDSPMYHGALNADQPALIASNGGELGPGSYVTNNPDLASEFARKSYGGEFPEGSGVFPLMSRKLETMPRNDWVNSRGVEMDRLRTDNAGEWNPDFYYQSMKNMADDTEAKGFSGWYTPGEGGTNQGVVFDPKNIRSRFAAFDPARAHESDLLAGLAPYIGIGGLLGLGAYGRQDEQPQY